jgi:hypothetical protein
MMSGRNPSPGPIPETIVEQFWHLVDEPLRRLSLKEIVQAAYSAGRTADERDTRDLQDALMLLRIFLTRKDMATVECHKKKVADWMQRKGRQGSILRAAIRKGDGVETKEKV